MNGKVMWCSVMFSFTGVDEVEEEEVRVAL